jgi:hypothetical protein
LLRCPVLVADPHLKSAFRPPRAAPDSHRPRDAALSEQRPQAADWQPEHARGLINGEQPITLNF